MDGRALLEALISRILFTAASAVMSSMRYGISIIFLKIFLKGLLTATSPGSGMNLF